MEITRTQVGLTALFIAAIAGLVFATLGVLNPELIRGPGADGSAPGLSPLVIATLCLTVLTLLGTLIGLGTMLSEARNYGGGHFAAVIAALLLFILGFGVPIAGAVGGSYAQTGDVDAYRSTLTMSAVGGALAALSTSVAAWFLFKPNLRIVPAIVGVARAVGVVGQVQAMRAHSSLVSRTFGNQTVYLPTYDVPADSGPIFTWQVVNWALTVVLVGMWALLLFASDDTMVKPADDTPTQPAPEPVPSS